jgi:hypothetical protein
MDINGVEYTIGADPEVFVGENGNFISAHGLVQGDKKNPFKVNKGAVQVDGMALEFNIDPAKDLKEFQDNLTIVQQQLKEMIGDKQFLQQASVFFEEDFTKDIPIENLILGCEMDFNGWEKAPNPTPDQSMNMRTAGGHLHIGGFFTDDVFEWNHFLSSARLSRIMDEQVGVYSVLWDKDDQRRSMYGQAGCFRPKEYGMEYRTLSNSWLFSNYLTEVIYFGIRRALERFQDETYEPDPVVREIINTSNRDHTFFKGDEVAEEILETI